MKRNLVIFATLASIAGCGAAKEDLNEEFSDLSSLDEKSDQFSKRLKLVGSLDYGQTSGEVKYHSPPRYRAFKFGGAKGDQVDISVRSANGDAYAWLVDNSYKIVAKNDDSDNGTDSHITATLPGNRNPDIITYYIIFREYFGQDATFTVELKGPAKDFYQCAFDADCVAVPAGGCCPHGVLVAVNSSSVDAYNASVECTANPRPLCPLFIINDTRVAQCNSGTNQCEMIKPEDIRCGGFTRNPHQCADGYSCRLISNPDVPGICIADPQPAFCDGIAGIQCPTDQVCVDNPNDSCDPNNGGADCGGICQPKPADCRTTGCGAGRYCSFCWGSYACIPDGALC